MFVEFAGLHFTITFFLPVPFFIIIILSFSHISGVLVRIVFLSVCSIFFLYTSAHYISKANIVVFTTFISYL